MFAAYQLQTVLLQPEYEEWLESIKGEKGNDGVGIQTAIIDDNGDLIITYTDGEVVNAGHITGEKEEFIEGTSVSCKVDDISYKEQTISVFAEMTAVDILDSDCSVDISELNHGKPIDNDSEYYYGGKYIYRLEVSIEGSSSLFGEKIPYISFWMYPGVYMNCNGWAKTSNVVFDEEGNSSYSSLFVLSYIVTGIDVACIDKR